MNSFITNLSYVLITPARNEEKNIERVIKSVISQTILPLKWIIINDASTDRTGAIVSKYIKDNSWIELVNMPVTRNRSFAAKVECFYSGYVLLKEIDFDIIGNLDADISFEKNYIEFLLSKFLLNSNLGVAGTPFVEDNGYCSINDSFEGEKHVPGGCQLFRRKCFEEIGGYVPNKIGGIDWIAVTTARMKGWETKSFFEKKFHHHRHLGTGESHFLSSLFNYGRKDYYLGNHPFWEFLRIIYRMTKRPYILGSLILLTGYLSAFLTKQKRPISKELIIFHRKEEMNKLRRILITVLNFKKLDKFYLKS